MRIGIHTGLVVIGEIGNREKREVLALGETPNLAARLQGLAEPDTVVMSGATYRLSEGFFACRSLGPSRVKGISAPIDVYQVLEESGLQSRFEVAIGAGLTPLVGREEELSMLQRRWAQAKEGAGQVVLLGGEAGIGKSRLVQALKEQVSAEGAVRIEFRCSPYHQNSALYPIIEQLQRMLRFERHDQPEKKLKKLEEARVGTHSRALLPPDTIPLLASLLSLPHPEGYPPLTASPQKQKEKTQEALVAWIIEEAEKAVVYCAWEDLHWADPSTLEVLTLFLGQIPTARVFSVLTSRPEFTPPWSSRSYLTSLTLGRLGRQQVEAMVMKVTGGKTLPSEVLQQVVSKTDGVPLFVEELTKVVMESSLLREEEGHYELTGPLRSLAIPSTLQDSLMARLDQLAPVRELAQWGATLGREFSYELIHSVSQLNEAVLQHGLRQLVDAELIYQRGLPPQATYVFKHALIQDTAYQSLLKSKRRQLHHQIARVLEEQFAETKETQPELLAHHYTEAGLDTQAIPYWQRAGERAIHRSAHVEAISHLTKGLELLKTLLDTPERAQQELTLLLLLGMPMTQTVGYGVPEAERVYARALALCRQAGETPQLFPTLHGLYSFYSAHAKLRTAQEVSEQLLSLAQRTQDPLCLVQAHHNLASMLCCRGELVLASQHLEQGIAGYGSLQHRALDLLYVGIDPGVACLYWTAWVRWQLGHPNQALKRIHEALALAQELSHPHNTATTLILAAALHQFRREPQRVRELAEAAMTLATDQGFPMWLAFGTMLRGWALTEQGQVAEGKAQIQQGLAAYRAAGAELWLPYFLALLAEAQGKDGQVEVGLSLLVEALETVSKTEERWYEAELYRLKGTLTLQKEFNIQGSTFKVTNPQPLPPNTQHLTPNTRAEAEECFLKALAIARQQQAKSFELHASMSLARLWQQQGKHHEAHALLADIYKWFTEGFDTKDLQDAKALLEELSERISTSA